MNSPAPASPSMWTGSSWAVEAPSCLVRVECGVYSRELILWQDSALQVSWGLNPPEMIVSHAKK